MCGTYADSEKIRAPLASLFLLLHASLGCPLPMSSLFTAASKDETPQLSSFGSTLDNFLLGVSYDQDTLLSYNQLSLFYASTSASYNLASILTSLLETSFL